jgi:hypothetical protein
MDPISAVSDAARQHRATIASVFQWASQATVVRHHNSGLDATFATLERIVRRNIAAEIPAMTSLARHLAVEGFGEGLKIARRQSTNPTNGRQGKRPAVGAAHVVGKIEQFVNVSKTSCWRFRQIAERFQLSERRRSGFAQGAPS